MNNAVDTVERVLSAVDYLRVTLGPEAPSDRDWLSCNELVSDPDALAQLVRTTAPGRGTDRDDVAVSLFVQGYAFRIASIAFGAWLVDGIALDVAPEVTHIALGRDRPNAVHLDRARAVPTTDSLGAVHQVLIDGHLALLVDSAHRACRIGRALLWSNIGAGCASSFGAFMASWPDRHDEIRDRFTAFLAAGRSEFARSGRIVPVGSQWAWERSACCLWYTTESGFRCEDCSLWTDTERQARYDAALAGPGTADPA